MENKAIMTVAAAVTQRCSILLIAIISPLMHNRKKIPSQLREFNNEDLPLYASETINFH